MSSIPLLKRTKSVVKPAAKKSRPEDRPQDNNILSTSSTATAKTKVKANSKVSSAKASSAKASSAKASSAKASSAKATSSSTKATSLPFPKGQAKASPKATARLAKAATSKSQVFSKASKVGRRPSVVSKSSSKGVPAVRKTGEKLSKAKSSSSVEAKSSSSSKVVGKAKSSAPSVAKAKFSAPSVAKANSRASTPRSSSSAAITTEKAPPPIRKASGKALPTKAKSSAKSSAKATAKSKAPAKASAKAKASLKRKSIKFSSSSDLDEGIVGDLIRLIPVKKVRRIGQEDIPSGSEKSDDDLGIDENGNKMSWNNWNRQNRGGSSSWSNNRGDKNPKQSTNTWGIDKKYDWRSDKSTNWKDNSPNWRSYDNMWSDASSSWQNKSCSWSDNNWINSSWNNDNMSGWQDNYSGGWQDNNTSSGWNKTWNTPGSSSWKDSGSSSSWRDNKAGSSSNWQDNNPSSSNWQDNKTSRPVVSSWNNDRNDNASDWKNDSRKTFGGKAKSCKVSSSPKVGRKTYGGNAKNWQKNDESWGKDRWKSENDLWGNKDSWPKKTDYSKGATSGKGFGKGATGSKGFGKFFDDETPKGEGKKGARGKKNDGKDFFGKGAKWDEKQDNSFGIDTSGKGSNDSTTKKSMKESKETASKKSATVNDKRSWKSKEEATTSSKAGSIKETKGTGSKGVKSSKDSKKSTTSMKGTSSKDSKESKDPSKDSSKASNKSSHKAGSSKDVLKGSSKDILKSGSKDAASSKDKSGVSSKDATSSKDKDANKSGALKEKKDSKEQSALEALEALNQLASGVSGGVSNSLSNLLSSAGLGQLLGGLGGSGSGSSNQLLSGLGGALSGLGLGGAVIGSTQRYQTMLADIQNPKKQYMGLQELSEFLSFSSEDNLITFPVDQMVPALLKVLSDPVEEEFGGGLFGGGMTDEQLAQMLSGGFDDFGSAGPDVGGKMVLACRCLYSIVDLLPIKKCILNGLPTLITQLQNIQYIDVAEQVVYILEKISEENPLAVVKANGLPALLNFFDFFNSAVQRKAASAIKHMTACLMFFDVNTLRNDLMMSYSNGTNHVGSSCGTLVIFKKSSSLSTEEQMEQEKRKKHLELLDQHKKLSDLFNEYVRPCLSSLSQLLGTLCSQSAEGNEAIHEAIFMSLRRVLDAVVMLEMNDRKLASASNNKDADRDTSVEYEIPMLEEICPLHTIEKLLNSPKEIDSEMLYILAIAMQHSNSLCRKALQELSMLDVIKATFDKIVKLLAKGECSQTNYQSNGQNQQNNTNKENDTSGTILAVLSLLCSILPVVRVWDVEGKAYNGKSKTTFDIDSNSARFQFLQENDYEILQQLAKDCIKPLLFIFESSVESGIRAMVMNNLVSFILTKQDFVFDELLDIRNNNSFPKDFSNPRYLYDLSKLYSSVSLSGYLGYLIIIDTTLEHRNAWKSFVRQGIIEGIRRENGKRMEKDDDAVMGDTDEKASVSALAKSGTKHCSQAIREISDRILARCEANGDSNVCLPKVLENIQGLLQEDYSAACDLLPKLLEDVTCFELLKSGILKYLVEKLSNKDTNIVHIKPFLQNLDLRLLEKWVRLVVSGITPQIAESLPLQIHHNDLTPFDLRGFTSSSSFPYHLRSIQVPQRGNSLMTLKMMQKPIKIRMTCINKESLMDQLKKHIKASFANHIIAQQGSSGTLDITSSYGGVPSTSNGLSESFKSFEALMKAYESKGSGKSGSSGKSILGLGNGSKDGFYTYTEGFKGGGKDLIFGRSEGKGKDSKSTKDTTEKSSRETAKSSKDAPASSKDSLKDALMDDKDASKTSNMKATAMKTTNMKTTAMKNTAMKTTASGKNSKRNSKEKITIPVLEGVGSKRNSKNRSSGTMDDDPGSAPANSLPANSLHSSLGSSEDDSEEDMFDEDEDGGESPSVLSSGCVLLVEPMAFIRSLKDFVCQNITFDREMLTVADTVVREMTRKEMKRKHKGDSSARDSPESAKDSAKDSAGDQKDDSKESKDSRKHTTKESKKSKDSKDSKKNDDSKKDKKEVCGKESAKSTSALSYEKNGFSMEPFVLNSVNFKLRVYNADGNQIGSDVPVISALASSKISCDPFAGTAIPKQKTRKSKKSKRTDEGKTDDEMKADSTTDPCDTAKDSSAPNTPLLSGRTLGSATSAKDSAKDDDEDKKKDAAAEDGDKASAKNEKPAINLTLTNIENHKLHSNERFLVSMDDGIDALKEDTNGNALGGTISAVFWTKTHNFSYEVFIEEKEEKKKDTTAPLMSTNSMGVGIKDTASPAKNIPAISSKDAAASAGASSSKDAAAFVGAGASSTAKLNKDSASSSKDPPGSSSKDAGNAGYSSYFPPETTRREKKFSRDRKKSMIRPVPPGEPATLLSDEFELLSKSLAQKAEIEIPPVADCKDKINRHSSVNTIAVPNHESPKPPIKKVFDPPSRSSKSLELRTLRDTSRVETNGDLKTLIDFTGMLYDFAVYFEKTVIREQRNSFQRVSGMTSAARTSLLNDSPLVSDPDILKMNAQISVEANSFGKSVSVTSLDAINEDDAMQIDRDSITGFDASIDRTPRVDSDESLNGKSGNNSGQNTANNSNNNSPNASPADVLVRTESKVSIADSSPFISKALTNQLLKQLNDPVSIGTRVFPGWLLKLPSKNQHLFGVTTKKILHATLHLGTQRGMQFTTARLQTAFGGQSSNTNVNPTLLLQSVMSSAGTTTVGPPPGGLGLSSSSSSGLSKILSGASSKPASSSAAPASSSAAPASSSAAYASSSAVTTSTSNDAASSSTDRTATLTFKEREAQAEAERERSERQATLQKMQSNFCNMLFTQRDQPAIPRQKVRINRTRMLDSAIRLMGLYSHAPSALEVEYQGEIGTGSGPTLEFYTSVAELLKSEQLELSKDLRDGTNGLEVKDHKERVLDPGMKNPRSSAESMNASMKKQDSLLKTTSSAADSKIPMETPKKTDSKSPEDEKFPTVSMFRSARPGGYLFPAPLADNHPYRQQILDLYKLLGELCGKAIIDNRLVDIPLHPLFWKLVKSSPDQPLYISASDLSDVDPEVYSSLNKLKDMPSKDLEFIDLEFRLPGYDDIILKRNDTKKDENAMDVDEDDSSIPVVNSSNLDEYIGLVVDYSLIKSVQACINAFRNAFLKLHSLESIRLWSELELSTLLVGVSTSKDEFWTLDHLTKSIQAKHGYNTNSRVFNDLLKLMNKFTQPQRKNFLSFVTGAQSLPPNGFAGLRPPLVVVRKEESKPDSFLPSVMTCANYLKLPEYTTYEVLEHKMAHAINGDGLNSFLLS